MESKSLIFPKEIAASEAHDLFVEDHRAYQWQGENGRDSDSLTICPQSKPLKPTWNWGRNASKEPCGPHYPFPPSPVLFPAHTHNSPSHPVLFFSANENNWLSNGLYLWAHLWAKPVAHLPWVWVCPGAPHNESPPPSDYAAALKPASLHNCLHYARYIDSRDPASKDTVCLRLWEVVHIKWAIIGGLGSGSGLYDNLICSHRELSWWLVTYLKTSTVDFGSWTPRGQHPEPQERPLGVFHFLHYRIRNFSLWSKKGRRPQTCRGCLTQG